MCVRYLHLFGETGSGNILQMDLCIFYVIEMSGSMLGSTPEVVQQAEIPLQVTEGVPKLKK